MGGDSIFDNMTSDDVIMAFFPCIRFESQIHLQFRGVASQMGNWTDEKKLEYGMKLHDELHLYYKRLCQLCIVAIKHNLRLVIENPYTSPHYLIDMWCLKPKVIDRNRRLNGDWWVKPTQYWFVNCEPKQNLVFESMDYVPLKTLKTVHDTVERSMIHPQYASRFIRQYVLDENDIKHD